MAEEHDDKVCPATRTPGFTDRGRGRRRRAKATGIQESLFGDLESADRVLVEVDGWLDFAAIARNGAESPEVS